MKKIMRLALVDLDELSETFEDYLTLRYLLNLEIISEEKLLALRKQDYEAGIMRTHSTFEDYLGSLT